MPRRSNTYHTSVDLEPCSHRNYKNVSQLLQLFIFLHVNPSLLQRIPGVVSTFNYSSRAALFFRRILQPCVISVSHCRSMNAYLVVYLCILIGKALVNTALKYLWQADPNRDEPWYNHRTETERQRHIVSPLSLTLSLNLNACIYFSESRYFLSLLTLFVVLRWSGRSQIF